VELNRFPLGTGTDGSVINHPANVTAAYVALAELRHLPLEILAAQVEQNFFPVIWKPKFPIAVRGYVIPGLVRRHAPSTRLDVLVLPGMTFA